MKKLRQKDTTIEYIYFALAAFIIMLIATRSSFLYPYNNWDDANSYFTMGKSLFNGKVLYRDVFDQKGMYLYFIYGLAYLVSHTTFIGVFVIEIIAAFFDIWGFARILEFYARRSTAVITAPLMLTIIVSSRCFYWGGAAEEICMPFLIVSVYLTMQLFEKDIASDRSVCRNVALVGLLAGFVANIKFNVLGLYMAYALCIGIYLLFNKRIALCFKIAGCFLGAMLFTFIPWVVYFAVNGALYDWYWGYVYVNVFAYAKFGDETVTVLVKLKNLLRIFYTILREDMCCFSMLVVGVIGVQFIGHIKRITRILVPSLMLGTFLGIYIGGRTLPYYAIPVAIFGIFGLALIVFFLDKITNATESANLYKKPMLQCGFGILVMLTCLCTELLFSNSVYFMKQDKDTFFLTKFKNIIEEDGYTAPTLLNAGCLDAGLYTVCDIVPNVRWFQTQTLDMEEGPGNPYYEQYSYVKNQMVDYVLVRDGALGDISAYYELVDSVDYSFPYKNQELTYNYSLYRRNN